MLCCPVALSCRGERKLLTCAAGLGLSAQSDRQEVNMGLIFVIIILLLLVGVLPTWPYSTGWGYYPSGGLGLILLILIVLLLMGRL